MAYILRSIPTGDNPLGISLNGLYLWVANSGSDTVSQIRWDGPSPVTNISIPVGDRPFGICSYGNYTWVANYDDNTVSQINCNTSKVVNTLNLTLGSQPYGIACSDQYVWIATNSDPGYIYQYDYTTSPPTPISYNDYPYIEIGINLQSISYDGTYLWVASSGDNSVYYIDYTQTTPLSTKITIPQSPPALNPYSIHSHSVIHFPVPTPNYSPYGIFSDATQKIVWVSATRGNNDNGGIFQIDWNNTPTISTVPVDVGIQPNNIFYDGKYLWVVNSNNPLVSATGSVSQLDYTTTPATVVSTLQLGIYPFSVASNGANVFVSVDDEGNYHVTQIYVSVPCFAKNTKILTDGGYKYIQDLRVGDLVKTFKNDYKPIKLIGTKEIYNPSSAERIKDQLYKCSTKDYNELFEDLIITGCHSILVGRFVDDKQRNKTIEVNGNTFVTDGKYRLPACADDRAQIYEKEGQFTVYHFALEHADEYMNYGVYANGLLVETCCEKYLRELSSMHLTELH